MAVIFVLDRYGSVRSVLDNQTPKACPYWNDSHVESLDGELSYDFECAADHEASASIEAEALVLWQDLRGAYKLARIKTVDEQVDSQNRHVKLVHAEGVHGDLNGHILPPTTFQGSTLADTLASILGGTEWEPGIVEWDGIADYEFTSYQTVLAALRTAISQSNLEWRYRVTFDGNTVTGRFVDALKRIGEDNGKTFTHGKDIKGLRRTTDSSEFVTALIGLGGTDASGNQVTFTDEVWGESDPALKPADQNWVGDIHALSEYGHSDAHIVGVFEDTEETSPSKLLAKTWAALQTRNEPKVSYEIDAALLDRLSGHDHERIDLGDTVTVQYTLFDPPLLAQVRVSEIRRSYSDPTGTGFSVRRGVL
jgi:phage minor structural protein